jgi:ABC-type nitrate/sulfonate/bicarbonate transport system substrate-binding protein
MKSKGSRLLPVGIAVILAAAAVAVWKSSHRLPGEVRIAYLPIIPSLPVFVVQEQHLFEKENLKVEMLSLSSSNDLVNALVAGQADMLPAVSLIPIVHLEIQHPGKVRVFSHSRMNENNALDKIIVKENSRLRSVQDLRGTKIGVFPGTAPQKMLVTFLKKHGVDADTISFVQLAPQAQLSSLESGAVDALFSYEPVTTTALAHGGYRALFGSVYADLLNPCPIGVSVIARDFERLKPEAAQRSVKALQEGITYMAANQKFARTLLPKFTKLPPEIAERVNISDVTLQNQVDVANLQAFIDLLYTSGEIAEKLDAHRLVDPTR